MQISGSTGAFVAVLSSITAQHGIAGLQIATLLADAVNVAQQRGRPAGESGADFGVSGSVLVFSTGGPLFFGAAEKLEGCLKTIPRSATTLILRLGNVPFVDATGIFVIEEISADFKRRDAYVLLVEVRPNVRYKLERGGVIAYVGRKT